jgi:hypothetical protein
MNYAGVTAMPGLIRRLLAKLHLMAFDDVLSRTLPTAIT